MFKNGDIIVWSGAAPCIGRINSFIVPSEQDCYAINKDTHNSLHVSNLRLATKNEIKLLGSRQIFFLSKTLESIIQNVFEEQISSHAWESVDGLNSEVLGKENFVMALSKTLKQTFTFQIKEDE